MKVRRSVFTPTFVGLIFFGLLVLSNPISGFAGEPHVCINGAIATNNQNLGSTTQISWAFGGACGHQSLTYMWKFSLVNGNYPFNAICPAQINNTWFYIPPDTELHTFVCTIPRGPGVKLKATVGYYAVGTGFMTYTDNLTNK